MALLNVVNLGKTFGTTVAVKAISFQIEEGRCVTLLGPNGAGKSTTLRMLSGLLTPTNGTIALAGMGDGDIRKLIGYLPQYPAFYPWMTGKEYLVYTARLSGMSRASANEQSKSVLASVGLAHAGARRISGYSGGMKQRLGLAQAMIHRPRLMILDEPVSSLDPIGRREVLDLMRAMKKETTILFSTHVLPDAEEISDDLLIMNTGEIVVAGEKESVMDTHRRPVIRLRAEQSLEGWQSAIAALEGVERVECRGEHAEIIVSDRDRSRSALMALMVQENIAVRKLEVAELSLEDLFMKAVKQQ